MNTDTSKSDADDLSKTSPEDLLKTYRSNPEGLAGKIAQEKLRFLNYLATQEYNQSIKKYNKLLIVLTSVLAGSAVLQSTILLLTYLCPIR